MFARVLRGTKEEITAAVVRISGEVREAIVFMDDPASPAPASRDGGRRLRRDDSVHGGCR